MSEHKKLVAEGLQFNSYFAQHEVVLASTMGSQDQGERQEAFDIIASLRKKEKRSNRKTVRKVKNPQVNLHASKLSEMVNLKKATSSPTLFFKYSDEELRQFLQELGQGLKLTTEAATVVSGAWNQDTVTWNRVAARKRNATRFKKEDWLV